MSAPRIAVIYYSLYGHVKQLADQIARGIVAAGGHPVLLRVAETLPAEVLEKMHAPPADATVPIASADDLAHADGILLGFPTRFGTVPAQVKALLDSTGGLWQKGALMGKPVGCFFSTATQAGGQETTALSLLPFCVHHGMLFVPIGYSNNLLFDMTAIHGGSPYGSGTMAGANGSRQPSDLELKLAEHQGSYFTAIVSKLKKN